MADTFKSDEEYIFKAEFIEDYGLRFMPTGEGIVRCKDCKQFRQSTMYKNCGVCLLANDEGYGVCREVHTDSFCSWGERKDKVEE